MATTTVDVLTGQLRAAAWHDAAPEDDRIVYEMRTGRPWAPELPDLLICTRHTPCRILDYAERAAVETITGPPPSAGPDRLPRPSAAEALGRPDQPGDVVMILSGDEWPEVIPEPEDEGDPISWPCDECGADAGQECRPGCIAADGTG